MGTLPSHPPSPPSGPPFLSKRTTIAEPTNLAFTITLTSEGIKKCLQTAHFSKNQKKKIKIKSTQNLSLKGKENYNSFSVFRHHSPNNCYMQFKFLDTCAMGLGMKFRPPLLVLIIFKDWGGGGNTVKCKIKSPVPGWVFFFFYHHHHYLFLQRKIKSDCDKRNTCQSSCLAGLAFD